MNEPIVLGRGNGYAVRNNMRLSVFESAVATSLEKKNKKQEQQGK